MKLSPLDHQFIAMMTSAGTPQSQQQREIITNALAHKSDILFQSPGNWFMIYMRNWGMYFFIWFELLQALWKGTPPKTPEMIGFDTNYVTFLEREDYFRYNLPGRPFKIIHFYCRIPALPSNAQVWRRMGQLFLFMLKAPLYRSEFSREYVRVLRACWLVAGYVSLSEVTAVYLFHVHRHETSFLASYLQERGVHVNLVVWDAPLAAHNKYLVGDTLKLCNPYQVDEFKQFQSLGNCQQTDLWPLEKIHRLIAYYKDQEIPHLPNVIGLYTQGYWLRRQIGKAGKKDGSHWEKQERELVAVMTDYVNQHPDARLIIYPHPMERRHYLETHQYAFIDLQNHPQIEVDFSGENSMYTFNKVGLGITIMSSVGFERVYMGFRTLFYVPHISYADFNIPSPYNALYVRSAEELTEKVALLTPMTHTAFMESHFGGPFLHWRTTAF